ncbi:TspO/MBR family protein [Candidatus Neomarinimicrobiota bacterium]
MKIIALVISIIIAQGSGLIGSVFTASSVNTWFETISKPTWNPPSWIFGPVWISLYFLMGIAAYIVWLQKDISSVKIALWVYGIHLIFNSLWSILFFGLQNPQLAFFEIIILLILILITTVLFWKINNWAGALMIPYITWVSLAAFLNYTIWQLN